MPKPDLGKVRERMVDLEDHHEDEISVEGVMARLLLYEGDPDELGRAVNAECQRAMILMDTVYSRLGVKKTPMNVAAIGFLQGITFAMAFAQVAQAGRPDVAKVRALIGHVMEEAGNVPDTDDVALGIAVALSVLDSHHLLRDFPGTPGEYHAKVQAATRAAFESMFGDDERLGRRNRCLNAGALHRAADRVGAEAGTPFMDAVAAAGAEFIATSELADEYGVPFVITDPRALGYGIMLGYLAALEGGKTSA